MEYISETKKLARKWVYKLEWDLDPEKLLCPEVWDAILTEENKNPLKWSEQECEEFLEALIYGWMAGGDIRNVPAEEAA